MGEDSSLSSSSSCLLFFPTFCLPLFSSCSPLSPSTPLGLSPSSVTDWSSMFHLTIQKEINKNLTALFFVRKRSRISCCNPGYSSLLKLVRQPQLRTEFNTMNWRTEKCKCKHKVQTDNPEMSTADYSPYTDNTANCHKIACFQYKKQKHHLFSFGMKTGGQCRRRLWQHSTNCEYLPLCFFICSLQQIKDQTQKWL